MDERRHQKKFKQKMVDMDIWLERIRNLVKPNEWWKVLGLKLLGSTATTKVSGNFRMLKNFYHQVVRLAFKWVNRRSQRKSYKWALVYSFHPI
ncbi:MAG: hypothetical protein C4B59_13040 [Candidatus Methanogaster sp.]|uniref:Uncharacterized protein n=1 Tax=Candidatus Methanogaster sp. TaxID=3386292 RepID=A0AC61L0C7_9EURY|nr:MAG: hypothetical protein C4B59_13040 [ANME-2 cluster archaeon]